MEAIKNDYRVFYQERDREKYRALLTDDYLLLENGEILGVQGDIACAVYLLKSEITDQARGVRAREFLESAVLRRIDGQWRVALLHSTRRRE